MLEPTLVEHAPALRRGGYVIDFWGLGYDIAERMGLIMEINRVGYRRGRCGSWTTAVDASRVSEPRCSQS
jgi:hypothetical protein